MCNWRIQLTILGLIAVLSIPGLGQSGSKSKGPKELDGLLEQALASNPDISMARANFRAAEAALNKARLEVTRGVIDVYHRTTSIESQLELARKHSEMARARFESGRGTSDDVSKSMMDYARLKVEKAGLKSRRDYLLGGGGKENSALGRREKASPPVDAQHKKLTAKFEAYLLRRVEVDTRRTPLNELLGQLHEQSRMNFLVDRKLGLKLLALSNEKAAGASGSSASTLLSLHATEDSIQLRVVLSYLADVYDLGFVLRDYGIFVTTRSEAIRMGVPVVP